MSRIENEFKIDYEKLSQQCQEYASALLAETRTSQELETILNHDHENPPVLFENEQEKTNLNRLKLAIKYKQKKVAYCCLRLLYIIFLGKNEKCVFSFFFKFVSHPHCQQLLVSLWYDGISGYRRRNIVVKTLIICFVAVIFPFLSLIYLVMPHSRVGRILRQPFIKFICHSASYVLFLCKLNYSKIRITLLRYKKNVG